MVGLWELLGGGFLKSAGGANWGLSQVGARRYLGSPGVASLRAQCLENDVRRRYPMALQRGMQRPSVGVRRPLTINARSAAIVGTSAFRSPNTNYQLTTNNH
jgi:hypothetical protein